LNCNHCSRCSLLQCETKTAISKFATRFEECGNYLSQRIRGMRVRLHGSPNCLCLNSRRGVRHTCDATRILHMGFGIHLGWSPAVGVARITDRNALGTVMQWHYATDAKLSSSLFPAPLRFLVNRESAKTTRTFGLKSKWNVDRIHNCFVFINIFSRYE